MRNYGDDEMRTYVATGDPLDKAGSYGIQHPAFSPVERWDGCYASIMGLPLGMAARMLAAAGLQLRQEQIPAVCERASGAAHCCLRRFPPG
jgi:predicted house-cleaning NTP pyrophosphatase (Maf/HAM1 superfamily)